MTLYAESSAVLAWLLGQPGAAEAREGLASADVVVASDLTMVECDRVLIRATVLGELPEADAASRRAELNAVATHWTLLRLAPEVTDRARQRFPLESIRTLDALHLACALYAKGALPDLVVLSLDDHVRRNARALGFDLLPADDRLAAQPASKG